MKKTCWIPTVNEMQTILEQEERRRKDARERAQREIRQLLGLHQRRSFP